MHRSPRWKQIIIQKLRTTWKAILFSLLLLSSCTLDIQGEKDAQIKTLEQNISQLKAENQRIAKENTTLSDENKKLLAQTKVKKAETIQSEF